MKKRAAARAQPELAEHVSQCARSAELTESDRQALFHTPPVYTRDCPDCGTRFESQCARSAKCPQCLSLSLSLSLNALEAQSGVAAEADDGAADPFAELASWTTADLVQWIGDRHDNGAALAALDEACQALADDVRPEVEKRITEAYTWLARNTLADIASQCARSADELRDLDEEKEAIVEALTRWQESVPEGDELLELVQVRRPGYFALEDLGAALVELQQANVLAVDRTGGWYLTGDATPAEQGPVVTMVPVSTGTVIAHIRHDGAERYTLQSGAYKLDIVLPADYAEVTKLLMALLAAVSMRLEGFQEGPFAHVLTHKAWSAAMAALALVAVEKTARCYALDTPGPGGACHKFECAGITVQFQRGARGEPDSVAGVLDPDLLEVCKHVLYQREMPFSDDFELLARGCIELAINKLTERVTERIGRGVFGRHAA